LRTCHAIAPSGLEFRRIVEETLAEHNTLSPRHCQQPADPARKFQRKHPTFSTLTTTAFPTIDGQESAKDQIGDSYMTIRKMALVLCCLELAAIAHGLHAQAKPEPIAMTPPEMKWGAQSGLALAGMEQVNLVGDPSKPGPYTLRLKFPAGYKLAPHSHPDSREVTVLSGTWYTGYGEAFDAAALKALPAGSFYTEPANLSHFVEVREPVTIQVSGTGPSGRVFVKPTDSTR
jgi:hypothetical protein